MSTITIQLPEPLARQLRENSVPEQTLQAVVVEALQRWLDVRVKREHVAQPLPAEREGEAPEGHEYFRRLILEMRGGVPPSDDEPFAGGLTRGEYFALSDKDRAVLWDKWYAEELDKRGLDDVEDAVYEVQTDAVPA